MVTGKKQQPLYDEKLLNCLGGNLKLLRMQRRLSQSDMAAQLGMSQTHLSNIENGKARLSILNLLRCANLLHYRFEDFFTRLETNSERAAAVETFETTAASASDADLKQTYTLAEVRQLLALLRLQ